MPTHEQLGEMWERAKMDSLNLVIRYTLPDGTEHIGYVIGRGSKYSVWDDQGKEYVEDIRPEWVGEAHLTGPIERKTDRRIVKAAEQFVEIWGALAVSLPDDYGCTMTCPEVEAMAELFSASGQTETAAQIISEHIAADCDDPDEHER